MLQLTRRATDIRKLFYLDISFVLHHCIFIFLNSALDFAKSIRSTFYICLKCLMIVTNEELIITYLQVGDDRLTVRIISKYNMPTLDTDNQYDEDNELDSEGRPNSY